MYSYGNRAAIGSGRRGHGGGNYRPPSRKREKSNQQPPPIKECYCVAEWQVDEYSQPAESVRQHDLFGGRESMESYKSTLRQKFAIHLVVPGRRQAGRVMFAGRSHLHVLPAVHWLLQRVNVSTTTTLLAIQHQVRLIPGRIICRNPKAPQTVNETEQWIEGAFVQNKDLTFKMMTSQFMFLSSDASQLDWSVLVCNLYPPQIDEPISKSNEADSEQEIHKVDAPNDMSILLQTCIDNLQFRLGNSALTLETFVNEEGDTAFATGELEQLKLIVRGMKGDDFLAE